MAGGLVAKAKLLWLVHIWLVQIRKAKGMRGESMDSSSCSYKQTQLACLMGRRIALGQVTCSRLPFML